MLIKYDKISELSSLRVVDMRKESGNQLFENHDFQIKCNSLPKMLQDLGEIVKKVKAELSFNWQREIFFGLWSARFGLQRLEPFHLDSSEVFGENELHFKK